MSGAAFAFVLSLAAGAAGAVQVAVSGALGRRIGVVETTAFSLLISFSIMAVVVLVTRRSVGGVLAGFGYPPWLWLGGLMGVIIVSSITFAGPRIGTFATVGLLMASQLAMGAAIDSFGLFGVDRVPLTWNRGLGLVLLAGGAFLVVRR